MPAAPPQALPAPKHKGQQTILTVRKGAKKSNKILVQVSSPKKSQEERLSHRGGWKGSSLKTAKVVNVLVKIVTVLAYSKMSSAVLHPGLLFLVS